MEKAVIPVMEPGEVVVAEKEKKIKKEKEKKEKDELSMIKIELSLYRAQMAMVRTTTTMTTFGFALNKLLQEKVADGTIRPVLKVITPKDVALTLFFSGFLGLVTYTVKHIRVLKKLNLFNRRIYFSGVMLMSYVIMVLTLLLFIGTMVND